MNMWVQLLKRLKQSGLRVLRSMGLLAGAELLHIRWTMARNKRDNAKFLREHPDFVCPPVAAMHDAYGTVSLRSYWEGGQEAARLVAGLIRKHHPTAEAILEWGCGPARILRHMPGLLPEGTQFVGTDYNRESISWCEATIKNVTFARNELSPPLPHPNKSFDVIYAVSVLTHLSVPQQDAWLDELRRVLRPGGCLILTTHGEQSAKVLLRDEYARFQTEGVVVRSGVEEGKRCFLSYHHPAYVQNRWFSGRVCEYIPGSSSTAVALWGPTMAEQDIWVVR